MNFLLDLLFPRRCFGCGKWGSYLCEKCEADLQPAEKDICPVCSRQAVWGITHPGCVKPWALDGATALFSYKEPLRKMIQEFKYQPWVKDLQETLTFLMIKNFQKSNLMKIMKKQRPLVAPVPLHKSRIQERGYNQAEILGRAVAEEFGLEFVSDFLIRWRKTKPQVGLKAEARRENVKGAFKINSKFQIPNDKLERVILVDDVWTTGTTLKECGKVLKRAGAKKVWALTLARGAARHSKLHES